MSPAVRGAAAFADVSPFGRPTLSRRKCSRTGPRLAIAAALVCVAAPLPAQQKVPLVLSSLQLTLDSATYADVAHSAFMRDQFSATATGMLQGMDGGNGTRIVGRYNYLQLFPPGGAFVADHDVRADVGIILLTEHPGGLEQLKGQGGYVPGGGVTWLAQDYVANGREALPGGDRIRLGGATAASTRTQFEIMQYDVDAARHLATSDSLPASNLSSARFLRHYFDPTKLLAYVSAATIAISVDDITKIVAAMQRNNVPVIADGEGAIIKLDGFTLHLIPPYRGAGVKQLQFALTHAAPANPTYRFGPKSQLRFGPGLIAVWDFESK